MSRGPRQTGGVASGERDPPVGRLGFGPSGGAGAGGVQRRRWSGRVTSLTPTPILVGRGRPRQCIAPLRTPLPSPASRAPSHRRVVDRNTRASRHTCRLERRRRSATKTWGPSLPRGTRSGPVFGHHRPSELLFSFTLRPTVDRSRPSVSDPVGNRLPCHLPRGHPHSDSHVYLQTSPPSTPRPPPPSPPV